MQVDELDVISTSTPLPFQLDEEGVDETLRIRYRWLDLRRERLQRNIRTRARAVSIIRQEMETAGFVDIETPIMGKPHTRRRPRLPGPDATAARPILRAAAEPADLQAAAASSPGSSATTRSPAAFATRICAPTGCRN